MRHISQNWVEELVLKDNSGEITHLLQYMPSKTVSTEIRSWSFYWIPKPILHVALFTVGKGNPVYRV